MQAKAAYDPSETRFSAPSRPKLALVSTTVQILDRKAVQAQHEAARDLSQAKILSPVEAQAQIDRIKKERAAQAKALRAKGPASSGPKSAPKSGVRAKDPAPEDDRILLRFMLGFTDGSSEARSQFLDDGASPLPVLRERLLSADNVSHVTSEDFWFLVVYDHDSVSMTSHATVRYFLKEAAAQAAGAKTGQRFTVSRTLRRSDVLLTERAPARDEMTKSRDRAATKFLNYNRHAQWQTCKQDRCNFSRG